jgi:hypothetical protein
MEYLMRKLLVRIKSRIRTGCWVHDWKFINTVGCVYECKKCGNKARGTMNYRPDDFQRLM